MLRKVIKFTALASLLFLPPTVVALKPSDKKDAASPKDIENSGEPLNLNTSQIIYGLMSHSEFEAAAGFFNEYQEPEPTTTQHTINDDSINQRPLSRRELWDAAYNESQMARRYREEKNFDLAIKHFLIAIRYYEMITINHGSTNQPRAYWSLLQDCYRALVMIYSDQGNWQKSTMYLEKTIYANENIPSQEKTTEDFRMIFRDYGALATNYYIYKLHSDERYFQSLQNAINAFNAVPEREKRTTDRWIAAQIKSNMAMISFKNDKLHTAAYYLEDVINLIKLNPNNSPEESELLKEARSNLKIIKAKLKEQKKDSVTNKNKMEL